MILFQLSGSSQQVDKEKLCKEMQELMKTRKVEWNYVLRMCIQHHCYFGSFYTWSNIFLCLRGTFLSRLLYLSASLTDLKQNKFGTTRRQKSFVKLVIWSQNIHQCTMMSYVYETWPFQGFAILRIATLQFGKLIIYFNFWSSRFQILCHASLVLNAMSHFFKRPRGFMGITKFSLSFIALHIKV